MSTQSTSTKPARAMALLSGLARLTVAQQLAAAFGLLLLLMLAFGGAALLALRQVDQKAQQLAQTQLQGVGHLANARIDLTTVRDLEVKHSRTSDKSYHSEYEEKMSEGSKQLQATVAAFGALELGEQQKALFEKLGKALTAYEGARQKVVSMGRSKQQQDAADISDGLASSAFDEATATLGTLTKTTLEDGLAAAAAANATYQQARIALIATLALGLALGVGCALGLSRHLRRQLGGEPGQAAAVVHAVSEGDLTTRIQLQPGDSTSLMARLQVMQESLQRAVSQVRQGSENVATASAQIAQGNQDLSNRTEQQASGLQQTAATMDELGSTVRNNADNARQANQLAQGASTVATKGGEVVGQVVQTMRGINDSSKKIADIIGVIDGIAFQTNILALNAAVEAARAGEQGRGFAVVASEVRSLAQRSAEAAKEIKSLISASVERVEQGTALVDQAGQTMEEIVSAIRRVSDIVGEISSASVEQSSGVAQVGQAITQMDQVTQQNAALVEESAAAADSLRQQAMQLLQAVAVFKLGGSSGQQLHAPAPSLAEPVLAHAPSATPAPAPAAAPASAGFSERRGPNRAKNVTRPDFKAKATPAKAPAAPPPAPAEPPPARTGTTDEWESF